MEIVADFEMELGFLIEKWRQVIGTDAIIEGLDLFVLDLEESRDITLSSPVGHC